MNQKTAKIIRKFTCEMYKDTPEIIDRQYRVNKKLWNATNWKARAVTRQFMKNPKGFTDKFVELKRQIEEIKELAEKEKNRDKKDNK